MKAVKRSEAVGKRVVQTRWVDREKDGRVKSRLVLKDFKRSQERTQPEMFSLTPSTLSLKTIWAASSHDRNHHPEWDYITTAMTYTQHSCTPTLTKSWLQSHQNLTSGTESDLREDEVWKLNTALYGYRKAPKLCHQHVVSLSWQVWIIIHFWQIRVVSEMMSWTSIFSFSWMTVCCLAVQSKFLDVFSFCQTKSWCGLWDEWRNLVTKSSFSAEWLGERLVDARLRQIRSASETWSLCLVWKTRDLCRLQVWRGQRTTESLVELENEKRAVYRTPVGKLLYMIPERCPKRKVFDRDQHIPTVCERAHRQRLGRTTPNFQEHKWWRYAVEKRNHFCLVKNTAVSEPEFCRSRNFRCDNWNLEKDGDEASLESADSTPINTPHTAQYSLFTCAEHITRARLKNCITPLCAWEESVIWSAHVSLFVALSPAIYHEHIIFLIHSSFHHDTRTRTTIRTTRSTPRIPSTSWTSPGSPSRQAAPSGITLAWKLAELRTPAQNNSHRSWARRACDSLKDRRLSWRSMSILWCTGKNWRKRSPSPDHRTSEGIWRNRDTRLTRFWNIRDVLFPIAHALRRFRRKHCRFWSRRWRVTRDADFTTVSPESFGEPDAMVVQGREVSGQFAQANRKENLRSHWSEGQKVGETQCIVFIWAGKFDQEFCVQKR